MALCAQCGRESPDEFGFCPGCGASLAPGEPAREVRKVVTVLFCDLTGSTALGDRTDPETLRALMNRYFDAARAVLERHGGTVEKFVGDAVMAVFGIPVATEDDALRAVRAAVELRAAVADLGLEARIGVNTGGIVAGEGGTLVTGDAVNVAARLEQAARPGEVLLGDDTLRLVRDAARTEPVALVLKGKPQPVSAHRLLGLDTSAEGVARRLDRPLVGRLRERERLRADFADVVAARSCRMFTLIGPAGVGKSRLVADFLDHVGDGATVARCRALSYGEGITYWPLVELLLQLGIDPDEAIRSSPADIQLATRARLEQAAESRPLVLVLDDLHWAEPPLLDLVEHVADWARDAPIFLLCVARPELLDLRPGWGGGKLNATSLLLEALPAEDAEVLADGLLGERAVDREIRDSVLAAAEGNPLFIEEMAALTREAGSAVAVPPTIHAVLQARLDRLTEHERAVIECGAVEGKVFHRGAVTALGSERDRGDVPDRLLALVRKEIVRPDRTQIPGDDAFRFRHLLIRDTAYETLPKATRADLHERFADWLASHGNLLEQDEIVGYHLEQAARYRRELDPSDERAGVVAERAAERLGTAGTAAYEREDWHATRNLIGRAVALAPHGLPRRRFVPLLVEGKLQENDTSGLAEMIEYLERGDELDRAHAAALRAVIDPVLGREGTFHELFAAVVAAQPVLEDAGDLLGVARCERARAHVAWGLCKATESHRAARRSYELLREAGSTAFESELMLAIPFTAFAAGMPLDEVREELDWLSAGVEDPGPLLASGIRVAFGRLDFMAGLVTSTDAEAIVAEHVELLRQTGSPLEAEFLLGFSAYTRFVEGDDAALERERREKIERLEALDDRTYLANVLGEWAGSLCRVGDPESALRAVARGRALLRADDVADNVALDSSEAFARALLGDRDGALALLERASGLLEEMDMVPFVRLYRHMHAQTLEALGDAEGARAILRALADDAERRGYVRFAERFRRDLEELG